MASQTNSPLLKERHHRRHADGSAGHIRPSPSRALVVMVAVAVLMLPAPARDAAAPRERQSTLSRLLTSHQPRPFALSPTWRQRLRRPPAKAVHQPWLRALGDDDSEPLAVGTDGARTSSFWVPTAVLIGFLRRQHAEAGPTSAAARHSPSLSSPAAVAAGPAEYRCRCIPPTPAGDAGPLDARVRHRRSGDRGEESCSAHSNRVPPLSACAS